MICTGFRLISSRLGSSRAWKFKTGGSRVSVEEIVMINDVIHDVMTKTQAGEMTFPEVVQKLLGAGVESYFVDYAMGTERIYMADGSTRSEAMTLPRRTVAAEFSVGGLVEAIRGAQADTIRYPEFARRATEAGVIGYWAYLTGKKVIYFGRKGEKHVEEFPRAKS
jgi:uncharacterized protein YbcV (DUF1398 family)